MARPTLRTDHEIAKAASIYKVIPVALFEACRRVEATQPDLGTIPFEIACISLARQLDADGYSTPGVAAPAAPAAPMPPPAPPRAKDPRIALLKEISALPEAQTAPDSLIVELSVTPGMTAQTASAFLRSRQPATPLVLPPVTAAPAPLAIRSLELASSTARASGDWDRVNRLDTALAAVRRGVPVEKACAAAGVEPPRLIPTEPLDTAVTAANRATAGKEASLRAWAAGVRS
ncbi:hypothetical protein E8L99_16520 [Phreatobacter aquaticus]|uniref:Uncharacterized protein n=1 Tax=Phreatobacter aquaticus TaxID=2570229 RepID=A0A4D7QNW4_9HYPH|nr:hypothetical protein [Phreatobacter aquaticus]QCK87246.1 hypothetical protein E8L99_16520 [Phreatobacter aquaticus]